MEDKYVYGEVATKVLDSIYKEFEYNFTGEDIKKMMKDLDIASAVNTLKRSICAKELNIVAYEESNREKTQDIESRLNIKKLNETLNNIIESRFYGYSVSEIVYAEDWSFIVKAKSRELFDFDKESKRWFYKSDFDKVYIEDNKFLVSVNNPHKAYKGESILYELFQEYQIKRELDKKLAGIIDKYGDRIIWYLYDPNAEESEVKEQAEGLKQARNGHVIAIPGSANLEMDKQFGFITLNDLKTEIHQQLLVRYEKKIDKYILGNTLAQNEGTEGRGSYAQAQTHAQQQETVVTDLATYVEEELRKLLVIDADINGYDAGDFYIKLSDKIDIDEEIEREKKKKEVEKEEANILSMKMDVISKMSQTGYKISLDEMKEFTGFKTLVEVERMTTEFQQKKTDKIGVTRELRKKYEESYREVSIELPKIAKLEDIFNLSVNLGQLEQDMILGILWGYASVRNINSEFAEKLNPFDLAFDDAIKYFIDVERIGYDFISGVQSEVYDKCRYILDNTNLEIQLRLIKNIQKNLETGGTFRDWLANSQEEIGKMGLGKKGSYFETVYRTNLQTAYSVGNYKAQVENKKTNPYWLYDGVRDGREQDHTKKYDGKIWRADDKIWDSIYPPNDYNCRCNVIALDEEEFQESGENLEISNKRYIDEQKETLGKFAVNPAKNYFDGMKKSSIIKKKSVDAAKEVLENTIFEQIKTTKELETYVKSKNLSDIADFSDIHIDYAKEWVKGVEENLNKIPELRNNMKFIGSCQGRNRKYLEILYEKKFESYREMLIKMGYKDEDFIKKAFEKQAKSRIGKIPGNVVAQSMPSDEVGGITLNSAIFKKTTNLDFFKKGVESKFHPVGCDTLKATLDHEIGHEIDTLLGISELDEIINLFRSMTKDEITEKLSTYAWKNGAKNPINEFVDEAWSEYTNNPKPREIADRVGKIIEKRYATWRKK